MRLVERAAEPYSTVTAAPANVWLYQAVMVPWHTPPQSSSFNGSWRFFASRFDRARSFTLSVSTPRSGWCQLTRYRGLVRVRNCMITVVSRSETARGPLLARFTHEYGKLRLRSTCPFTQRRSLASPSGFTTGSTHRSMPLIGRPSISPYATY